MRTRLRGFLTQLFTYVYNACVSRARAARKSLMLIAWLKAFREKPASVRTCAERERERDSQGMLYISVTGIVSTVCVCTRRGLIK